MIYRLISWQTAQNKNAALTGGVFWEVAEAAREPGWCWVHWSGWEGDGLKSKLSLALPSSAGILTGAFVGGAWHLHCSRSSILWTNSRSIDGVAQPPQEPDLLDSTSSSAPSIHCSRTPGVLGLVSDGMGIVSTCVVTWFGGRTTWKLSSGNGKERLEVPSLGGRVLILGGNRRTGLRLGFGCFGVHREYLAKRTRAWWDSLGAVGLKWKSIGCLQPNPGLLR